MLGRLQKYAAGELRDRQGNLIELSHGQIKTHMYLIDKVLPVDKHDLEQAKLASEIKDIRELSNTELLAKLDQYNPAINGSAEVTEVESTPLPEPTVDSNGTKP